MTLLEALVALVVLGLSAVGYLQVFQAGSRSIRDSEAWDRAVAVGESAMESELLVRSGGAAPPKPTLPDGFTTQVAASPWRGRLTDIVVTVQMPGGQVFTMHRLVRPK
jgi:type II secretory pathway pseudopilin PulG